MSNGLKSGSYGRTTSESHVSVEEVITLAKRDGSRWTEEAAAIPTAPVRTPEADSSTRDTKDDE
jgi:hypothetical protein